MTDPKQAAQPSRSRDEPSVLGRLYDQLHDEEETRVCKDIPDSACRSLPRNYFAYLLANTANKVADELASARLVLPWMLGSMGIPAGFVGFLVPLREMGVLLPQLFIAAYIRSLSRRKGVWLVGAGLCALALSCMAIASQTLEGSTAGWVILLLVLVFSLGRGFCSVSAKDVMGKTVSKTRRGSLMGLSAAIAGVATLLIGIYVERSSGTAEDSSLFLTLLLGAIAAWLISILCFASIREAPGATEGGESALTAVVNSLSLLKTDLAFRRYVIARTLLLSVALVPPFFVLLAQQRSGSGAGLGLLIIASGLAGSISAPIWGRMGDHNSRNVMVFAALGAGATGMVAWMLDSTGWLQGNQWIYALLFLMIAIFHGGVRLGRKVYLVDMANEKTRFLYVAVGNTVIGVMMLAGGAVGVLADLYDTTTLIALLSGVSILAAVYIARMPDVSG